MTTQQETQLDNHLRNSATQQDKTNLKGHLNAAGNDHTHSSAQAVTKWVAGVLSVPAAGLSWLVIKRVISKHV